MEYKVELNSLDEFKAWSGARETLNVVRERGGIEQLTWLCEEIFSGTIPTEVEINDWLWFDDDYIYRSLGYDDLVEE
ncbi:TPA: hypothetical protein ACGO1J_001211 [Streptococcus suis]|uniref:hypothetical protein n=1 Tax=Streptococcus TaxID=1301 RepID=UPI001C200D41|nr:hypothetical protein [Streptococcus parasuis]QWV85884.1 hypothetical protein KQ224_07425 [Streptococcus parasuis]HEM3672589.1 hypothetical protein [Streptococcus suis]